MAKEEKGEDLYVGIDLGTSRSSISTSDDQRFVVESYVGWPVDMVARKLVKRDVLIGYEALENRSMLELHRPLAHGLLKEGSEKEQLAVRQLVQHLMRLAGVEGVRQKGGKIRAVVGVPAEALRVNKQNVRDSMKGFVDALLIVSEPFAVAYGLDALLHAMVVDVGAGTTDFCVMKGRYPTSEDQRTLPNAGDWVDNQLQVLLQEKYTDLKVSIHTIREWKETASFVGSSQEPVMVTVPIAGKPTELDITEEMKIACEGLIPPIAETMLDLISSVEPEYQAKVRNNILLAGGSSAIIGFDDRLVKAMARFGGGKVAVVKDPVFGGSDGGLSLAVDTPKSDWEKVKR